MPVYTARRKQCAYIEYANGRRCTQVCPMNRKYCREHMGESAGIGPSNSHYVNGDYSSALPPRLAAIAKKAATDPALLELNHAIGVIDARTVELMQHLSEEGLSEDALVELFNLFNALDTILLRDQTITYGDREVRTRVRTLLKEVRGLLSQTVDDIRTWNRIFDAIEVRRKLVDTEAKRRKEAQVMISSDQAFTVVHQLVLSVRRHVTDPAVLTAISRDIAEIVSYTGDGHNSGLTKEEFAEANGIAVERVGPVLTIQKAMNAAAILGQPLPESTVVHPRLPQAYPTRDDLPTPLHPPMPRMTEHMVPDLDTAPAWNAAPIIDVEDPDGSF